MFDFPAAPLVGDEYTSGGVTYAWTGAVWDLLSGGSMTDYVLKAGDTMTGALLIGSAESPLGLTLSQRGAAQAGIIEFWAPDGTTRRGYIGYGSATHLNITADTGMQWQVNGGLNMGNGGGINWGTNSSVTAATDLSKGICLYGYGTTSQFGFSVTSGTLNYLVQNAANKHNFLVGAVNALQVNSTGARIGASTAGMGYFIGDSWHGMYFDGSNTLVFTEYHNRFEWRTQTSGNPGAETGTLSMYLHAGELGLASGSKIKVPEGRRIEFHDAANFLCSTNSNRIRMDSDSELDFFIAGVKEFYVNSNGGNLLALGAVADDLGVTKDAENGGVSIGAAIIALLGKVKTLEAEIATLKGA